jgi:hypothetical protein
MGSRYGGLKQVEPVGPGGETLMDYGIYDACRAGFGKVVFVIRRDFDAAFRTAVGDRYAPHVPVEYAFQSMDDLPSGWRVPEGRTKPWGTAHAIRAARWVVHEPFAAMNADDYYGRESFDRLAAFLSGPGLGTGPVAHFAMVAFHLRETLSTHGSVARGICRVSTDGFLLGVRELTRLVPLPDGGAENRPPGAPPERLTGNEPTSMNLWAFTPALFHLLEERFGVWLSAHIRDPSAEWYIPEAVDGLVREGKAVVEAIPTPSSWFGVTYRDDRPRVQEAIAVRVAAGEYPPRLWA